MELVEVSTEQYVLQRFRSLIKNGRLAHAYLFVGPDGIGKFEAALALAKYLNCEEHPDESFCGKCSSCRKIEAGTHPDILVLDKEDLTSIRIEKVRELIARSQLRPYEAKRKVFVIRSVEALTTEGANALLKTLEEPGPSSLLVLTSSVPEKLLGTVRSRCHAVRFFPWTKERLIKSLGDEYSVGKEEGQFLAYFCEGFIGRARQIKDDDLFNEKNEILDNVLFSSENEHYLKGVLKDRQQTKQMLDVLLCWVRDMILMKSGFGSDRLVNVDRVQDLDRMQQKFSYEQLGDCLDEIVDSARMLSENLNINVPIAILKEKLWAN